MVVMLVKMVTVFNAVVLEIVLIIRMLVASPMGVTVTMIKAMVVMAMAIATVLRVLVVAIVLCVGWGLVWGARG